MLNVSECDDLSFPRKCQIVEPLKINTLYLKIALSWSILFNFFKNLFRFRNPTWWKRRTALERKLIILTLAVVIFAVALTAAAVTLILKDRESSQPAALNSSTAEARRWNSNSQSQRVGKSNQVFLEKANEGYGDKEENKNVCTTPGCVHAGTFHFYFL